MEIAPLAPRRALEVGIYRDGDNNLDEIQDSVLDQAFDVSNVDHRIEFTVQDTSMLHAVAGGTYQRVDDGSLGTDEYRIDAGRMHGFVGDQRPHEMSDENNLSAFVAHTLDEAEACGARRTWIDLVDHGGGDGGGLETSDGHVMPMPKIASAIEHGVEMHARAHPEDAARRVDGIVANQCLMATMGFADALSRAGVRYLAASPETMVAPGVPTSVAEAIANNPSDAHAMARDIVANVMNTTYDAGSLGSLSPAAAFDVLDCDPQRVGSAERAIRRLNDALVAGARDPHDRAEIRDDIGSVDGMARIPNGKNLPWRADRPAIAVYDKLASDARLSSTLRADARAASSAVSDLVLAHAETAHFSFGGASYRDAAGPTVHLPTSRRQVDPWAPRVSETANAFYRAVHAPSLARAIA